MIRSMVRGIVRGIAQGITGESSAAAGGGEPSQFIINGEFSVDSDWTKNGGWTISGGMANNIGAEVPIAQTMVAAVTPGNSYTLSFEYTGFPLPSASVGINNFIPLESPFSETFVALAGANLDHFQFVNQGEETGTLDKVSLVPA